MEPQTKRQGHVAFWIFALVAVLLGVALVAPFVPALLWASVLTVLLYPLYVRWRRFWERWKWTNPWADTAGAVSTTLSAVVIIVIPFVLIAIGLALQIQNVSQEILSRDPVATNKLSVKSVLHYIDESVRPLATSVGAPQFSAVDYVTENRKEIGDAIQQPAMNGAKDAGTTVITLIIALLTTFFLLRDGHRLKEPCLDLLPLPRDRGLAILERVAETIRAVFVGTVLVAILQGSLMGLTFWIVGAPNPLLLGVFSVIFAMIPLLGAPVIYLPIGLFYLLKGDLQSGLAILLVGGLFVSQIDNLLKPFLIGGRANLHAMAVFFAILGGVLLLGPIGIMAGPMLLTLLLALVEIVRENRMVGDGP